MPSSSLGRMWIALAIALGVAAFIGRLASAALLEYAPLGLVALSPLGSHLLLVVPLTAMLPFVVVGTARRGIACVVGYGLGREYGEAGIRWAAQRYPRFSRLIGALERLFRRAGVAVLLVAPGPVFCALAGATGMRFWVFLPVALTGQAAWITGTYLLGDALRHWITPVLGFISENLMEVTAALIVLGLLYQWQRWRRRRASALSELARAAQQD